MAETTKDCSSNDNILATFSNLDEGLQSSGPSSPVVSTNPEIIAILPPNSPTTYLLNRASTGEQDSPDSASTMEASDNDPAAEFPSTARL